MKQLIDFYLLSIKYWLRGDSWEDAKHYAEIIVNGFK